MKLRLALTGPLCLAALAACAQQQKQAPAAVAEVAVHSAPKTPLPPKTPVLPYGDAGKHMLIVKDVMRYVLNPSAESFWQWGGEVDGKVRTPTTDAEWNSALEAASTVMESANLLTLDGRSRTDPIWAKAVTDLNNAGAAGIKAVEAHDGEATFNAGSDMFDACAACHYKFIKRTTPPLP
jgi:hypothetical protein